MFRITDLGRRLGDRLTSAETDISTNTSDLAAHLADTTDAHDASAISVADSGALLTATDVEAALAEIAGEVDTNTSSISTNTSDITALEALFDDGTYTPTLTNMAVGTGGSATNSATYTFSNGILLVSGRIIFGTSGTTFPGGSDEYIGLPSGYTRANNAGTRPVGWVRTNISINQVGTLWDNGPTSSVTLQILETGTPTYGAWTSPSASVPASWAAGSVIDYQFVVRATRD